MRRIILIFMAVLLIPVTSQAQVPRLVHYQGTLHSDDEIPFTGTTDLQFNIYGPTSVKPAWSELHKNVQISNGSYEVLLGSQNPLKLYWYNYLLEVKADEVNSSVSKKMIVGSGYKIRMKHLFAAYTIAWLAISIYLLTISRRQKKLISELEAIAKTARRNRTGKRET